MVVNDETKQLLAGVLMQLAARAKNNVSRCVTALDVETVAEQLMRAEAHKCLDTTISKHDVLPWPNTRASVKTYEALSEAGVQYISFFGSDNVYSVERLCRFDITPVCKLSELGD